MDYTSTLETLECFWMTLSWCLEHQVKPWVILYPFVKVSNAGNSSWWSTMRLVNSQSIIQHAISMDYTSTLHTLEDFWMRLSCCFEHQVGALAILYSLVKLSTANC